MRHNVGCYCGLVARRHQPGEFDSTGAITAANMRLAGMLSYAFAISVDRRNIASDIVHIHIILLLFLGPRMTSTVPPAKPAFPFIKIDADGQPGLIAQRCTACGATYPDCERVACGNCGGRADVMETFAPSLAGTLHSAVIVMRGFPGISVPFISAVVDLDDGPTLKGTLRDTPGFSPADAAPGQRVRVRFDDALGRTDKDGNSYIAHFFEPISA